ncbi:MULTISPECIES: GntR family transcriptional regulator [unclassified Micromonospora]|uniref:GntR family transcriptional regulator n=1 Tax=Micromonospora TaxID=1873 RepID=UPI001C21C6A1|nr:MULTISPECIES: GntR family transcriptional regulator [unclassified Micromonospora]MBU8861618.1 GntR family transcriptional regulator [Micromonospora sp. WMMB482]MDM4781186.1 GntR family transcriptional regulator [Micromonospora sp. b486]
MSTETTYLPLEESTYQRVRAMLLSGEIPTGQPVNQSEVAVALGVSRTPVRRALARLEGEGLVTAGPRGWHAVGFDADRMTAVFEIRAVLEGLACRLAAGRAGRAELARLRVLFQDAYEQLTTTGSAEAYYQADVVFHRALLELAGEPLLSRTAEVHHILTTSLAPGLYRDPHETHPEHLAIIEALAAGDADRAEELARGHIRAAVPNIRTGAVYVPGAEAT